CFVSVQEPHDPYICGEKAFAKYDVDSLPLSPSLHDELNDRPNIYKKAVRVWKDMNERNHREAMACYYASITEIDQIYGRLIDKVEQAGELDNTIIVLSADHGDHMGAHGLYCKNFGAGEEVYNVPLLMAGPGIASGVVADARVGLQDLCPTMIELAGQTRSEIPDSRSFASILSDPEAASDEWQTGYAEYFGGRMLVTQRVIWDGPWKLVFNGFDFDELYNLEDDPYEMNNLAEDPQYDNVLKCMLKQMWQRVADTGDAPLLNSHYPILRVAPYGPNIRNEE
ncbi:MAG: sulfatase-like hydrolase/transferase, partial [Candidatus Sumerlaeota bacterium]